MSLQECELDLPLCVSSGQVFRWWQSGDGSWIGIDGDAWFVVDVSISDRLQVQSNKTEKRFRDLFRLDVTIDIDEILRRGPELEPYVRALPGLRLMKPSNPVEETFCFLCTANNNLTRITKMVAALGSSGQVMDRINSQNLYRFPSIEDIAALPEHELRTKGFGYRAATIPAIARQMLDRGGEQWLAGLKKVPYQEAHDALAMIKGIGPKLSDCICLFALHHTEAVPVDTHLWQAAVRHYFPEWKDKSLTGQRYRSIGDLFRKRFGALAGYAHQYLFYDNMQNWRTYRKGSL